MVCPTCKKVSGFRIKRVLLRGHYNPTVKQKQHPNLQWFKLASGQRIKICSKCLKTSQKNPAHFKKLISSVKK